MSGSFWKFGQNYANEAPLTKLLNKAFFRIHDGDDGKSSGKAGVKHRSELASESDSDCISVEDDYLSTGDEAKHGKSDSDEDNDDDEDNDEGNERLRGNSSKNDGEQGDEDNGDEDDDDDQVSISENNFEYKDYRPNLDILDDLLDDEELYTELMCSNFKLLVFFRYPEVLAKLVDYVTNEHVLEQVDEGEQEEDEDDEHKHAQIVLGDKASGVAQTFTNVDESEQAFDSETKDGDDYDDHYTTIAKNGDSDDEETNAAPSQNQTQLDAGADNASESSAETSITLPPESEEQVESRRARIAAEILSADVWTISSAFMDNEDLLIKLWSTLEHPAPLSIIASTYFMKINERLLDMDINGMINFILKQDNIVDRFIAHIDNPPLMDFLLKVISTDKPDAPTDIIALLNKQNLISKLLDYLSMDYDSSIQSAAGDFLKALITISANSNNEIASAIGPNELTRELVSPEMVAKLVKIMLQGGTSLSNGVGIVIELIRKNNSDYDFVQVMYTTLETHPPTDRDPVYLGHLVREFATHMDKFNKILVETKLDPLETPFGTIEPLGFERFKICELVAELLHCSNMGLLSEPSGESIVRERDLKRKEILRRMELDQNDMLQTRDSDENDSPLEKTESPADELQKDMQNLHIKNANNAEGTEDVEDVEDVGNVEDVDASSADRDDLHSENSSGSEVTEKTLRENPVVGDLLKISLQDNNIITTILGMFFKFPWNNFLHNVVFDIVQQVFNGPLKTGYNRFLLADLFSSAHITEVIMNGDRDCVNYEKETGIRLGYMGHLTLIAEEVVKFAAYIDEANVPFDSPVVMEGLNEPKWKEYCDTILTETREKYSSLLGEDGIEEGENEEAEDEIYDEDMGNDDEKRFLNVSESMHFDNDQGDGNENAVLGGDNCFVYEDSMGNKTKIQVHMDENEKDASYTADLNKFSNYMSNQIKSGLNMADSDEEEEAEEEDEIWNGQSSNTFQPQVPNKAFFNNSMFHSHQFDLSPDDEEDYLDPNDDGQSYAKPNHPLYSSMLSPGGIPYNAGEDDLNDLDVNDEDDDDEDDDEIDEDMDANRRMRRLHDEYTLHRTSSNDKIVYNESEKDSAVLGLPSLQRSNSYDTE
ncbi:hypothetical protein KLU848_2469 [Kluyveromyces marxianus]